MQGQILKNKYIFFYSAVLALALCLLKWLESRFLIVGHLFKIDTGGAALIFTLLGYNLHYVWLSQRLKLYQLNGR